MKKIKMFLAVFLITFSIIPTSIEANVKSNDNGTIIENVEGKKVSLEEMINNIAHYNNISYEQALNNFLDERRAELPNVYARNTTSNNEILMEARRWYYWEDTIYVGSSPKNYKAAIYVYYSYMGSQSNRSINQILDVGVRCNIMSPYKHYNGTLFINVESQYKYFYRLNGAFYNTGTTTSGVSLNLSLGQSATLTLGNSTSSSFYDAVYASGRIVSSRN